MDRIGQLWSASNIGESCFLVVGREAELQATYSEQKVIAWHVKVFINGKFTVSATVPEGNVPWEQSRSIQRLA